ncbi:unnamed protein product [Gordionus sp. m RMFG-2023]
MAIMLEEILKVLQTLALEGKYAELYDGILKNYDIFAKNISYIDNYIANVDINEHSLLILFYLKIKFNNFPIVNATVNKFYEFIDAIDVHQINCAIDIYSNVCHSFTQYLIINKTPLKGMSIIAKAITNIQNESSELTTIHSDLLHLCLSSRDLTPSLQFLDIDITSINKENNKCDSKYILLYYYYGGLIYLALKNYERSFLFFEIGLTIPAHSISLIMVETLKKYIILSLLTHNKVINLPKFTSNIVVRVIKPICQPYLDIANAYMNSPNNIALLENKLAEHTELLNKDGNMGLAKQLKKAFHKNHLKKLSKIYLTISIDNLTNQLKLQNENLTKRLLIEMIMNGEIHGKIDEYKGIMVFYDEDFKSYYSDGDKLMKTLREEGQKCMDLRNHMEKITNKISTNPQYIQKVFINIQPN